VSFHVCERHGDVLTQVAAVHLTMRACYRFQVLSEAVWEEAHVSIIIVASFSNSIAVMDSLVSYEAANICLLG